MATVIDELIVKLGLDPTDFTKGQKTAAKELLATEKKTKTAADNMGSSVAKAARTFALAFLGFSTATGFVKMLAGLNETERQLGFLAKNTDNSAAELRNWANMADLAGGSAAGLLGTVAQIAQEQSNFQLKGESNWAPYLAQLGLAQDALSESRSELQVLMDLSEAFERLQGTVGGRQRINTIGLGMGIDQGTMNTLLQGPAKLQALLAKQRGSQFQISDATAKAADNVRNRLVELKQHGESFMMEVLAKLQPVIERLATKLEAWMSTVDLEKLSTRIEALTSAIGFLADKIGSAFEGVGTWLGEAAGKTAGFFDKLFPDESTRADNARAQKEIDQNGELKKLQGILGASLYERKTKYGNAGAIVDAMGLDEKGAMRMLSHIGSATGKAQDAQLTEEDYEKIQAMLRGLALMRAQQRAKGSTALAPNPDALKSAQGAGAAGAAERTAANTTIYNSTQVDNINVHTPATDGPTVAADIRRDIERKGLIQQADYGLA